MVIENKQSKSEIYLNCFKNKQSSPLSLIFSDSNDYTKISIAKKNIFLSYIFFNAGHVLIINFKNSF